MSSSSVGPNEIVIRTIETADAEAVSSLVTQLGYSRTSPDVVRWIEGLALPGIERTAFVACIAGELIAWIEVSIVRALQSEAHGLIGGLVVRDGVRGLGIGRALCAVAETWCWNRQIKVLRVTSRSTREAAHRFYLRDGYRLVKTSLVFEKLRPAQDD